MFILHLKHLLKCWQS